MRRMLFLILFELKKILNRKKALLFLLALNVVPLVASLGLLVAYVKFKGFGFGEIQFSVLYEVVQGLFTAHFKLFAFIAPFFLALVVGDSFSTELGRGYMKTLLLTPVRRWQVISAKTMAIMLFLLLAVSLGGFFLQCDLLVARSLTQPTGLLSNDLLPGGLSTQIDKPLNLVSTSSAAQLLTMTFLANLMLIGFFIVFALFFESAILMTFTSLSVLMGVHTFFLIATNFLNKIDVWYDQAAKWCFTRHLDELFSINTINSILDGRASLMTDHVFAAWTAAFAWAVLFYAIAVLLFSRRQILH
ncbi:MAG TPA: ABC transporter permease [Candidatus Rifleibacterium sp.]|nr:ABC transporter permease [Candidatus Rifleibacterium sp.]HPT44336.1 ABC transporter permease [Candidatus Rifleibacterium sp.]